MKLNMRKYVAEFFGTFILVFLGCGTAMLVGCDAEYGSGYMLTACAFGLAVVAGAYSIGSISGCHVNPAVSLACLLSGRMDLTDFKGYVTAQILGAFAGSGLLLSVFEFGGVDDLTYSLGSNSLVGVNGSWEIGLLVEIILTFIFVLTVLGVTSPKENHGSLAGLVIGLTLTAVHIIGIGLTGTSVNPARSIAPAVYSLVAYKDSYALSCLWVFILGPFMGAGAAAGVYATLEHQPDEAEAERAEEKTVAVKIPEPKAEPIAPIAVQEKPSVQKPAEAAPPKKPENRNNSGKGGNNSSNNNNRSKGNNGNKKPRNNSSNQKKK